MICVTQAHENDSNNYERQKKTTTPGRLANQCATSANVEIYMHTEKSKVNQKQTSRDRDEIEVVCFNMSSHKVSLHDPQHTSVVLQRTQTEDVALGSKSRRMDNSHHTQSDEVTSERINIHTNNFKPNENFEVNSINRNNQDEVNNTLPKIHTLNANLDDTKTSNTYITKDNSSSLYTYYSVNDTDNSEINNRLAETTDEEVNCCYIMGRVNSASMSSSLRYIGHSVGVCANPEHGLTNNERETRDLITTTGSASLSTMSREVISSSISNTNSDTAMCTISDTCLSHVTSTVRILGAYEDVYDNQRNTDVSENVVFMDDHSYSMRNAVECFKNTNNNILEKYCGMMADENFHQKLNYNSSNCVVVKSSHYAKMGRYLQNMKYGERFHDVIFEILPHIFHAHRIALACHSPYFATFFAEKVDGKRTLPLEIVIQGITTEGFEIFLSYVYEGKLDFPPNLIPDVAVAAVKFQMPILLEECLEKSRNLSLENAIQIICRSLSGPFYSTAVGVVLVRFIDVMDSSGFIKLDVNTVIVILSNNHLQTPSELLVFHTALRWIQGAESFRPEHAQGLLSCVRYSLMTSLEIFICSQSYIFKKYNLNYNRLFEANWIISLRELNFEDPFGYDVDEPRIFVPLKDGNLLKEIEYFRDKGDRDDHEDDTFHHVTSSHFQSPFFPSATDHDNKKDQFVKSIDYYKRTEEPKKQNSFKTGFIIPELQVSQDIEKSKPDLLRYLKDDKKQLDSSHVDTTRYVPILPVPDMSSVAPFMESQCVTYTHITSTNLAKMTRSNQPSMLVEKVTVKEKSRCITPAKHKIYAPYVTKTKRQLGGKPAFHLSSVYVRRPSFPYSQLKKTAYFPQYGVPRPDTIHRQPLDSYSTARVHDIPIERLNVQETSNIQEDASQLHGIRGQIHMYESSTTPYKAERKEYDPGVGQSLKDHEICREDYYTSPEQDVQNKYLSRKVPGYNRPVADYELYDTATRELAEYGTTCWQDHLARLVENEHMRQKQKVKKGDIWPVNTYQDTSRDMDIKMDANRQPSDRRVWGDLYEKETPIHVNESVKMDAIRQPSDRRVLDHLHKMEIPIHVDESVKMDAIRQPSDRRVWGDLYEKVIPKKVDERVQMDAIHRPSDRRVLDHLHKKEIPIHVDESVKMDAIRQPSDRRVWGDLYEKVIPKKVDERVQMDAIHRPSDRRVLDHLHKKEIPIHVDESVKMDAIRQPSDRRVWGDLYEKVIPIRVDERVQIDAIHRPSDRRVLDHLHKKEIPIHVDESVKMDAIRQPSDRRVLHKVKPKYAQVKKGDIWPIRTYKDTSRDMDIRTCSDARVSDAFDNKVPSKWSPLSEYFIHVRDESGIMPGDSVSSRTVNMIPIQSELARTQVREVQIPPLRKNIDLDKDVHVIEISKEQTTKIPVIHINTPTLTRVSSQSHLIGIHSVPEHQTSSVVPVAVSTRSDPVKMSQVVSRAETEFMQQPMPKLYQIPGHDRAPIEHKIYSTASRELAKYGSTRWLEHRVRLLQQEHEQSKEGLNILEKSQTTQTARKPLRDHIKEPKSVFVNGDNTLKDQYKQIDGFGETKDKLSRYDIPRSFTVIETSDSPVLISKTTYRQPCDRRVWGDLYKKEIPKHVDETVQTDAIRQPSDRRVWGDLYKKEIPKHVDETVQTGAIRQPNDQRVWGDLYKKEIPKHVDESLKMDAICQPRVRRVWEQLHKKEIPIDVDETMQTDAIRQPSDRRIWGDLYGEEIPIHLDESVKMDAIRQPSDQNVWRELQIKEMPMHVCKSVKMDAIRQPSDRRVWGDPYEKTIPIYVDERVQLDAIRQPSDRRVWGDQHKNETSIHVDEIVNMDAIRQPSDRRVWGDPYEKTIPIHVDERVQLDAIRQPSDRRVWGDQHKNETSIHVDEIVNMDAICQPSDGRVWGDLYEQAIPIHVDERVQMDAIRQPSDRRVWGNQHKNETSMHVDEIVNMDAIRQPSDGRVWGDLYEQAIPIHVDERVQMDAIRQPSDRRVWEQLHKKEIPIHVDEGYHTKSMDIFDEILSSPSPSVHVVPSQLYKKVNSGIRYGPSSWRHAHETFSHIVPKDIAWEIECSPMPRPTDRIDTIPPVTRITPKQISARTSSMPLHTYDLESDSDFMHNEMYNSPYRRPAAVLSEWPTAARHNQRNNFPSYIIQSPIVRENQSNAMLNRNSRGSDQNTGRYEYRPQYAGRMQPVSFSKHEITPPIWKYQKSSKVYQDHYKPESNETPTFSKQQETSYGMAISSAAGRDRLPPKLNTESQHLQITCSKSSQTPLLDEIIKQNQMKPIHVDESVQMDANRQPSDRRVLEQLHKKEVPIHVDESVKIIKQNLILPETASPRPSLHFHGTTESVNTLNEQYRLPNSVEEAGSKVGTSRVGSNVCNETKRAPSIKVTSYHDMTTPRVSMIPRRGCVSLHQGIGLLSLPVKKKRNLPRTPDRPSEVGSHVDILREHTQTLQRIHDLYAGRVASGTSEAKYVNLSSIKTPISDSGTIMSAKADTISESQYGNLSFIKTPYSDYGTIRSDKADTISESQYGNLSFIKTPYSDYGTIRSDRADTISESQYGNLSFIKTPYSDYGTIRSDKADTISESQYVNLSLIKTSDSDFGTITSDKADKISEAKYVNLSFIKTSDSDFGTITSDKADKISEAKYVNLSLIKTSDSDFGTITSDKADKISEAKYVNLSFIKTPDSDFGTITSDKADKISEAKYVNLSLIKTSDYESTSSARENIGDLLIVGGHNGQILNYSNESTVYKYSRLHDKWAAFLRLPEPRLHHSALKLGNYLYVVGGCNVKNASVPEASNLRFNYDTKRWTEKSHMRRRRMYHRTCCSLEMLYALGGMNEHGEVQSSVECYHPAKDSWRFTASMSVGRIYPAVAVCYEQIFVAGGYGEWVLADSTRPLLSSVERFNPYTNQWTDMRSLPFARYHANMVCVNEKLYIIGGAARVGDYDERLKSLTVIDSYDPVLDRWKHVTDMVTPRHAAGCALVDNKIYIVGGVSSPANRFVQSIEVYDVDKETWCHHMPFACRSFDCVVLSS